MPRRVRISDTRAPSDTRVRISEGAHFRHKGTHFRHKGTHSDTRVRISDTRVRAFRTAARGQVLYPSPSDPEYLLKQCYGEDLAPDKEWDPVKANGWQQTNKQTATDHAAAPASKPTHKHARAHNQAHRRSQRTSRGAGGRKQAAACRSGTER